LFPSLLIYLIYDVTFSRGRVPRCYLYHDPRSTVDLTAGVTLWSTDLPVTWYYVHVTLRDSCCCCCCCCCPMCSDWSRMFTDLFGECRFPKKWPRGSDWSDSKFKLLHSTGKLYWVILDYLPLSKHWEWF